MKKTALSLSLLFALTAGCLVGCDVKQKKVDGKAVIFSVGGTNVLAEDILGFDGKELTYDFLNTDEGVDAVYEAIYNALAQEKVEITSAIKGAVEEKMEDWDEEVKNYASSNGVTTRNATKTLLEQRGFENVDELEASYYLDEQKAKLEDMYFDDHTEPAVADIKTTGGTTMVERYVENAAPMIVKHILTNVADNSTIYNLATITEAEVDKFIAVMQRLALGGASRNSFKNVAVEESDDGTATKGGNLGIMDTYTSFVNEFKLGLYAAQMIANKTNSTFDSGDALGTKDFTDKLFGKNGIYPNYTVENIDVVALGGVLAYTEEDVAKTQQEKAGHMKTSEYDSALYPRNIIYNRFLNTGAIRYLKVETNAGTVKANVKALLDIVYPGEENDAKATAIMESTYVTEILNGQRKVNGDGIVVDENNQPIVVAKSEYGFHFLSVTWSALDNGQVDATKYFMYGDKATSLTNTYVKPDTSKYDYNFGYTTATVGQNNRKTEIDERIKNYVKGGYGATVGASDSLLHDEIFTYYLNNSTIDISNASLKKAVTDRIELQKDLKVTAIEEAQNNVWADYIEKIEAYNEMYTLLYK